MGAKILIAAGLLWICTWFSGWLVEFFALSAIMGSFTTVGIVVISGALFVLLEKRGIRDKAEEAIPA